MPCVSNEVVARYVLVMMYPIREEDGSLTHILRTLRGEEKPLEVVEKALEEAEGGMGDKDEDEGEWEREERVCDIALDGEQSIRASESGPAPSSPTVSLGTNRKDSTARTLPTPKAKAKVECNGAFTRTQLLDEGLLFWLLKDLRGPPLEFEGYVSGAETSDDEVPSSSSFLSPSSSFPPSSDVVGPVFYSGYLLKQSSRDPCLWRRRWCVLGENKIWYTKVKHREGRAGGWEGGRAGGGRRGKVAFLSLVGLQVLESSRSSSSSSSSSYSVLTTGAGAEAGGAAGAAAVVPFGIELHTAHGVQVFRAAERREQAGWVDAIRSRVVLSEENEWMAMAELVVGEEERARGRRYERCVEQVWKEGGRGEVKDEDEEENKGSEDLVGGKDGKEEMDFEEDSPAKGAQARKKGSSSSSSSSSSPDSRSISKSRRQARIRRLLCGGGGKMREGGRGLGEKLAFVLAVQDYRELCRLESDHLLAPPERKWAVAQAVYDEFLRGAGGKGGREEEVAGVLEEHAARLRARREGRGERGGMDGRGKGPGTSKPLDVPRLLRRQGKGSLSSSSPPFPPDLKEVDGSTGPLPCPPKELFDDVILRWGGAQLNDRKKGGTKGTLG